MSAHTPGPWEFYSAEESPNGRCGVFSRYYSDGDVGICGDQSKSWEMIEADARLIAAAPDMLEALRPLAAAAKMQPPGASDNEAFIHWAGCRPLTWADAKRAAKAIAKAEGAGPADGEGRP